MGGRKMGRIKGRYVAQIILEVDEERTEGMASFEEIKAEFGKITENIKKEFEDDFSKVEVTPQYSNIYEVETE